MCQDGRPRARGRFRQGRGLGCSRRSDDRQIGGVSRTPDIVHRRPLDQPDLTTSYQLDVIAVLHEIVPGVIVPRHMLGFHQCVQTGSVAVDGDARIVTEWVVSSELSEVDRAETMASLGSIMGYSSPAFAAAGRKPDMASSASEDARRSRSRRSMPAAKRTGLQRP